MGGAGGAKSGSWRLRTRRATPGPGGRQGRQYRGQRQGQVTSRESLVRSRRSPASTPAPAPAATPPPPPPQSQPNGVAEDLGAGAGPSSSRPARLWSPTPQHSPQRGRLFGPLSSLSLSLQIAKVQRASRVALRRT
ncbi:DNA-directed RNA polymerase subunit beta' [Frankliniella fusca]|uniref:DNA-directed RNA polymerase subunit beta n=1 Tax=Frankliniella fusca TaxID=407009 RepID=A0AAE1H065_9NEOP|nr:DNA-directed RNA polymerase subunit beta' [Frankliniella fusca]